MNYPIIFFVDFFFLQTIHLKQARAKIEENKKNGLSTAVAVKLPSYRHTGYDMRQLALQYRSSIQNKKGK